MFRSSFFSSSPVSTQAVPTNGALPAFTLSCIFKWRNSPKGIRVHCPGKRKFAIARPCSHANTTGARRRCRCASTLNDGICDWRFRSPPNHPASTLPCATLTRVRSARKWQGESPMTLADRLVLRYQAAQPPSARSQGPPWPVSGVARHFCFFLLFPSPPLLFSTHPITSAQPHLISSHIILSSCHLNLLPLRLLFVFSVFLLPLQTFLFYCFPSFPSSHYFLFLLICFLPLPPLPSFLISCFFFLFLFFVIIFFFLFLLFLFFFPVVVFRLLLLLILRILLLLLLLPD